MKLVITMTSWKGRINNVAFSIYRFYNTQSIYPDVFYLWLSEVEFPSKEKELPKELLAICYYYGVQIKWIKPNEYCFKRWYTCLDHYSDIIVSIDDDVFYDTTLLEKAVNYAESYEHCVINTGSPIYKPLSFNNSIKRLLGEVTADVPLHNMQLCGQCIFLPNTFPLEIVDESDTCAMRRLYCKRCDECGLTPLLVKHNVPIITHKWKNIIDGDMQYNAISNHMRNIKDIQLYLAIRTMPECMDAWKSLYPTYNTDYYDKMPLECIIELM